MQQMTTEEEYQALLGEHERSTDADDHAQLVTRMLAEFRHRPAVGPTVIWRAPEFPPRAHEAGR
jgi:hypothetical protein